jgi:hypothetical protein
MEERKMKKLVYLLIAVSLVVVLLPTAATALFATDTMGCTPGYWKQLQHEGSWVTYSPGDSYSVVFALTDGGWTLQEALQTGGGGEEALARHAVAALLNASNPEVGYLYTVEQVIDIVKAAYATGGDFETAKGLLEAQNELDCPLGVGPTETPTEVPA